MSSTSFAEKITNFTVPVELSSRRRLLVKYRTHLFGSTGTQTKHMDNDRSAMDYGEPKMTEGEIQYPMDNGAEIEAMAAALDEEDGNDCELCDGTGKDEKGKPCQECSVDYDADSAN